MASSFLNEEVDKKKEEEVVEDRGGLRRVLREYGTGHYTSLVIGLTSAACNGMVMPLFAVIFREIMDTLNDWYEDGGRHGGGNLQRQSLNNMLYFMGMGFSALLFTVTQYWAFGVFGSRISVAVRSAYMESLLRQDMAWHSLEGSGKVNARLVSECKAIQEGASEKLGFAVQQFVSFLFGFVLAFIYSWRLALVMAAMTPALVGIGWVQGKLIQGGTKQDVDPFAAKAGAVSQEMLTNLRVILAFPKLINKKMEDYDSVLDEAFKRAMRIRLANGFGMGAFMLVLFALLYPVALYVGAGFVDDDKISVGDFFGCFFSFYIAGMGIGQMTSVLGDVRSADIAANKLYAMVERRPVIRPPTDESLTGDLPPLTPDSSTIALVPHSKASGGGLKQGAGNGGKFEGHIEFRNVTFAYPTNPDKNVLVDVSFEIGVGKALALVGPSGSGKSTIVALLERHYDPCAGEILIDGLPIHEYNLQYLRSQMGLVSQMPLLFDCSVSENIRGGLEHVTALDIADAAKRANAQQFIENELQNGYDTAVGEMGCKLSGGQRQRVAIARALLLQPTILLLDEATSALDTKNEREVQLALDRIQRHATWTSVTIAHRLSTIQKADRIVVLVEGSVKEVGTHSQLMDLDKVYAALCRSQKLLEEKHEMLQLDRQRSKQQSEEELVTGEDVPPSYEPLDLDETGAVELVKLEHSTE